MTANNTAAEIWATMSPYEKQTFLAGSYTEAQAGEWLARVSRPRPPLAPEEVAWRRGA